MNDTFANETSDGKSPIARLRTLELASGLKFDESRYETKEDWVEAANDMQVHSTQELIESLKKNPKNQVEARIICQGKHGGYGFKKMRREEFLEYARRPDSRRLREAASKFLEWDDFGFNSGSGSEIIGKSDFTPLMGGPFNKQLYYRDYLRMISTCFYAYHHDPAAKGVTSILVDFTMGRGFQLHADDPRAQVIWNAFVEVNNFHEQMDQFALELSVQGEHMWWWLPQNQTNINFDPDWMNNPPRRGVIPRIRLLDPSNIAEITTVPEDINDVLFYTWLAPTQYQMYTNGVTPSSRFIFTQIPANQVMHVRVNGFSNEKRGRSDFFPALGYMKRLRDGVNYALVSQQKAAAWCLDTTIEGNASDIESYIQDQINREDHNGVQTAGSEFVHTSAIKREYLANSATSKGGDSPVFSWCLNMIAMSSGIPVSYLGTHLSGGSTRASALVSTEPVTKRFERRQLVMERTVRRIFERLCKTFGIQSKCEIIFPELLTQDRSALFKDLTLAQTNDWISPKRAAEIANKELDSKDFNYDAEMKDIVKQKNELGLSLSPTAPGAAPLTAPGQADQNDPKRSQVTGEERSDIKDNMRQL